MYVLCRLLDRNIELEMMKKIGSEEVGIQIHATVCMGCREWMPMQFIACKGTIWAWIVFLRGVSMHILYCTVLGEVLRW